MPKKIDRHTFSGPMPSLERVPNEPGVFIVQKRTGTYEQLVKTEAAEDLRAALASYARHSKLEGSDFFSKQQVFTLPLFSYRSSSTITTAVKAHYKELAAAA
jgi:hypothetical protein